MSAGFIEAVAFADEHHVNADGSPQLRKGTSIPYLSHLLSVAALVWEAGGDEDQAIAAVLHDVLEDTSASYAEVAQRFGSGIADLVLECSDGIAVDGSRSARDASSWRDRKIAYLAHLAQASDRAKLVCVADKLHNSNAILWDAISDELGFTESRVWERFNASPPDILWYYESLIEALSSLNSTVIFRRFVMTVDLMRERIPYDS